MEHLLFACCLEDAHHDAAEEAFAAMVHTFFDWNEVRVTSISELSEVMACLPDPRTAANRIKRVLHAVFEATFNFDLEDRRKKNLGPTIEWLEKLDGPTRFTVAYVVQAALGGHSIPIDAGTMAVLRVLDLVTDKDMAAGVRAGLGAGRGQVEGGRVRLAAARTWAPTIRPIRTRLTSARFCCKSTRMCAAGCPSGGSIAAAREQPAKHAGESGERGEDAGWPKPKAKRGGRCGKGPGKEEAARIGATPAKADPSRRRRNRRLPANIPPNRPTAKRPSPPPARRNGRLPRASPNANRGEHEEWGARGGAQDCGSQMKLLVCALLLRVAVAMHRACRGDVRRRAIWLLSRGRRRPLFPAR